MYYDQAKNKQAKAKKTTRPVIKILVTVLLIVFFICAAAFTGDGEQPQTYLTTTVQNGETLWQIAEEHYGGNINIQKKIIEIRHLNDLNNLNLQPGQKIKLPVNEI